MGILVFFGGFGQLKTKPNKANMSDFGWKYEALNPKSETNAIYRVRFEKTKPICGRAKMAQSLT